MNIISARAASNYQDIFSEEEIDKLLSSSKSHLFQDTTPISSTRSAQTAKNKTIKSPSPFPAKGGIDPCCNQRNKLIVSILSLAKQELQAMNNSLLVKGVDWVTNEVINSSLFEENSKPFNAKSVKKRNDKGVSINNTTFTVGKLRYHNTIKSIQNNTNRSSKPKKHLNYFSKLIPLKSNLSRPLKNLKYYNTFTTEPNSKEQTIHSIISPPQAQLNFIFSDEKIQRIDFPTFNIFDLEEDVGAENTLSVISSYVFLTYGLYSIINHIKAEAFLISITKGYDRSNPYHNDLHAADVLHTSMIIMNHSHLTQQVSLSTLDVSALYLSAIVHDFKHPGLTNAHLIQTSNKIALRYNDSSVLESYHIAQVFKLIKSKGVCDIFSNLSREDYALMRKRMIGCVLATDMAHHNDSIAFIKSIAEKKQGNGYSDQVVSTLFSQFNKQEQCKAQQDWLNVVIHSSDISNPTKPFEVYNQWAELVMNEFFLQGDRERELGLPQGFLCDRTKITIPQAQIGFIDNVILPFYTPLINIFKGLSFQMVNITNNKEKYKSLQLKQDKEDSKARKLVTG